jgi:hypothetical protein
MSRTNIFIRCTHPKLEQASKDIWDRPEEDGIIMKRLTPVGQLLGKSKREKRLADWIMATGVGLLGCALREFLLFTAMQVSKITLSAECI